MIAGVGAFEETSIGDSCGIVDGIDSEFFEDACSGNSLHVCARMLMVKRWIDYTESVVPCFHRRVRTKMASSPAAKR